MVSSGRNGASGGRAAQDRRLKVVEIVREYGELDVAVMPSLLNISMETVRRDLRALEEKGLVRRSYGRVFSVETGIFETPLALREQNHPEEKLRIARAMVNYIGQARTIFIDEGYQMQLVAQSLPTDIAITVVTAALPIASLLATRPNTSVIILGGRVRGNTMGVVDTWAVQMLERLNLDLAILGANGVSIDKGMTTPDPSVAVVKSAAVRNSERRVFCGAHHKFGRVTFVNYAKLADFELILTGKELGATTADRFAAAGANLVRV